MKTFIPFGCIVSEEFMQEKSLYSILTKYHESGIYPFHMPGHKRNMAPEAIRELVKMDLTEVEGTDNLHEAEGIIKDAQDFAAELYGADETHFLINGSSGGLLSAISAVCRDGGKILIARNCHKSVYHAIELHHLQAIYVYPEENTAFGINEGILPERVAEILAQETDIQAFVMTSPTYEGVTSDIKAIADIVHAYKIPLIVDEAHGAHFIFSDYFPESAISQGADLVIESTHKTLPALTQTALIHIKGQLVDRRRVRKMLEIYQTSSPSYILMGSIDGCLRMLAEDRESLFNTYIDRIEWTRAEISKCRYIKLFDPELLTDTFSYDRCKLLISVRGLQMSGQDLHRILLDKYNIQIEMASMDYILAMTSVGDSFDGFVRLVNALKEIDQSISDGINTEKQTQCVVNGDFFLNSQEKHMPKMNQCMSIYQASSARSSLASLQDAIGEVSSDYIYLYPPDIPIVTPGEQIDREVAEYISYCIDSGLKVTGTKTGETDGNIYLRIVEE